jgi:uncharacterized protein DUF2637
MDTTVDRRERVRQQARETYQQSLAAEMPLTGRQLGDMFERSDRWGRDRIAEVRRQDGLDDAGPATNIDRDYGTDRDIDHGERQHATETPRQEDARPNSADRARTTGPRTGAASPPHPQPRPTPLAGDHATLTGDSGHAVTGNAAPAPPTAQQPMPRPALGPWIAPASRTVPDVGTRPTPHTAPTTTSPGVSAAIRRTTVAAVTVVAAVAAVVSFAHMHDLAVEAGEGWRAWLLPLAVDGLIIAASMTMLVRRRQGKSGGLLAWCSLILGITASLAANVAAAAPTWEGRVVAAWPPIALLLSYELLMQQVRDTGNDRDR